jgi:hypothetical protein
MWRFLDHTNVMNWLIGCRVRFPYQFAEEAWRRRTLPLDLLCAMDSEFMDRKLLSDIVAGNDLVALTGILSSGRASIWGTSTSVNLPYKIAQIAAMGLPRKQMLQAFVNHFRHLVRPATILASRLRWSCALINLEQCGVFVSELDREIASTSNDLFAPPRRPLLLERAIQVDSAHKRQKSF